MSNARPISEGTMLDNQGSHGSALALMPGNDAEVITIKEAATLLRCSKAHVQNLLAGKVKDAPPLPFIALGRRKLIRRESLHRWLDRAEARC